MKPLDVLMWVASVVVSFLYGVTYVIYLRDNDPILAVFLLIEGFTLLLAVVYGVIRIRDTRVAQKWDLQDREMSENREITYKNHTVALTHRINGGAAVIVDLGILAEMKISFPLSVNHLHSKYGNTYLLGSGGKVEVADSNGDLLFDFVVNPGEMWSIRCPGNTYYFDNEVFKDAQVSITMDEAKLIHEIEAE